MIELLTISDLRFLPQTLTLQRSLETHANDFSLTVLCMDSPTLGVLSRLELPRTKLVGLHELEQADHALAEAKHADQRRYAWIVAPAFCLHRLATAPEGGVVAWVDADIEFFRDPSELTDQLAGRSVLLTPHLYNRAYPIAAPAAELTERYGRYNGGTVLFRRDQAGLEAAGYWRERTLACRDLPYPGRYDNQLHLADLHAQLTGVRVQTVPWGVIGPWNGGRFRIRASDSGPTADGMPVIAYHYQSLRLTHAPRGRIGALVPNAVALPGLVPALQARAATHYRISRSERRLFWRPHAERLARALAEVIAVEPSFVSTIAPTPSTDEVLRAARTHWELEASRFAPRIAWTLARAARRRAGRSHPGGAGVADDDGGHADSGGGGRYV